MEIKFPTPQEIEKNTRVDINGSINVVTTKELHYNIGGAVYAVPQEFKTDGASIPTFALALMSWVRGYSSDRFSQEWIAAAIIHDYFRRTRIVSDRLGDAVFYDILKQTTDKPTAFIMWLSVRVYSLIFR